MRFGSRRLWRGFLDAGQLAQALDKLLLSFDLSVQLLGEDALYNLLKFLARLDAESQ